MSEKNKNLLPPSVVDLLIFDTYKRNGIAEEDTKPLNDTEKQMIRKLIDDISDQVESFLTTQKTNPPNQTSPSPPKQQTDSSSDQRHHNHPSFKKGDKGNKKRRSDS